MSMDANLLIAAAALLLEAAFGYPRTLYARIRHPVVWMGAMIGLLDRHLNRATMPEASRRLNGGLAVILLLLACALPALIVQMALFALLPFLVAALSTAAVASTLLAQRSLAAHVRDVADGLERGLEEGRAAVARIVGRDPQSLDEAGVARAAIESLAENFSDGVVAPAFWCALLGLPGLAAYKAVNTADSMIGHRSERYKAFGWAAARLDDLVNLPASRLAAVWIVFAACVHRDASASEALRAMLRDPRKHRSPNAGWPEAAMAGALGLKLAGPRVYRATWIDDAWMGDGRAQATVDDIRRALKLYRTACALQIAAVAFLALVIAPA